MIKSGREVPLRYLLRPTDEVDHPERQVLSVYREFGVVPKESREDNNNKTPLDLSRYQLVRKGDLVVNKMKAWQGSLAISGHDGIVSPDYLVCSVSPSVDGRYLHYLLRSHPLVAEYELRSKGIRPAQWRLYWDDLGEISVRLPDLLTQSRIADFLNVRIAHLDRISAARARQLGASSELELAAISQTLSGSVQEGCGRPTGWPWLPTIPEDWSIGPIYGYYATELGKMLNSERSTGENQRTYLRNANVHWYQISTDNLSSMSFEPDEIGRYTVKAGDLLVCEGGAGVAEAAVWDGRIEECYFQKSLHRVRQAGHLPVEWLMLWLRLAKHSGVFESEGNISTIPHLTGEQLRTHRIPVPRQVPAATNDTLKMIDSITRLKRATGDAQLLIEERRTALITAAVTGQIDVSTATGRGIEDGLA